MRQTAFLLYSPLEQFEISQLSAVVKLGKIIYSEFLSDDALIDSFVVYVFLNIFLHSVKVINIYGLEKVTSQLIRRFYYYFFRNAFRLNLNMASKWASATFVVFTILLVVNLEGNVPGGTTATAHLLPVFVGAASLFVYLNFLAITINKWHMFNLFFPSGSPFNLALLIIPIEFVSYMFRSLSLSVRLFANMMAGHTLLKVIAGFGFQMLNFSGFEIFLVGGVVLVLVLLCGLELAVALIQTYVYITLAVMYYVDAIYLH